MSSRDIATSLDSYLRGKEVTSFRNDEDVIPVIVGAAETEKTLEKLFTTQIVSSTNGQALPLVQFASIIATSEPAVIRRFDLERTVTISVKHETLQASELNKLVKPTLDDIELPPGYRIALGGELKGASKGEWGAVWLFTSMLFGNDPIVTFAVQFDSSTFDYIANDSIVVDWCSLWIADNRRVLHLSSHAWHL